MWNSKWVADVLNGKLYGDASAGFEGCSIDSRKVAAGELFIALKGEQTDGHRYIPNAYETGASIVLAEAEKILQNAGLTDIPEGRALITVENTFQALQHLAKVKLTVIKPIVIGVTGSCGKTTTKDMIAAVLTQKYRVHKNRENYNNELGLPITILSGPPDTEIMVLEMGMRGLGQIQSLCRLCSPTVGVITNIGTTHMELLGSQDNIAQAKWELIECLPASGAAILNADDYYSVAKSEQLKLNVYYYGIEGKYKQPDILAKNIRPHGPLATLFTVEVSQRCDSPETSVEVNLPLPGEHNVLDALAALMAGNMHGISLTEGARALENLQMSKMRLEILKGINGSTVISDVYNANPTSMKASLQVLAQRGGDKTIAVLGEMYELGDEAENGHREVGEKAAELGIKQIVAVGPLSKHIAAGALSKGINPETVHICSECAEASFRTRELIRQMGTNVWVLVKGSRGMKMERISSALQES